MYFDRFDICEAYLLLENDWNVGGVVWERPSNKRRMMSTGFQLHRMGFRPSPFGVTWETLSENGREIYRNLCEEYGFLFTEDYEDEEAEDAVR